MGLQLRQQQQLQEIMEKRGRICGAVTLEDAKNWGSNFSDLVDIHFVREYRYSPKSVQIYKVCGGC
jgi:hypothetical protein